MAAESKRLAVTMLENEMIHLAKEVLPQATSVRHYLGVCGGGDLDSISKTSIVNIPIL